MASRSVQMRKMGRSSGRRPSPEAVEKAFGLQPGETYEYEDLAENETVVSIHGFAVHLSENEVTGSTTAWVKGAGNIGFGQSKQEARQQASKALSDPELRERIRVWLSDPDNQPRKR